MGTNLIQKIDRIYNASKDSKFNFNFSIEIENDIEYVMDYFITDRLQSIFLASIFALNSNGDSVGINELKKHFDCSPLKILEHTNDFIKLCELGLIFKVRNLSNFNSTYTKFNYTINENILMYILNNESLPEIKKIKNESLIDVLEVMDKKIADYKKELISREDLLKELMTIIHTNSHFPLIKEMKKYKLNDEDAILYLNLVWNAINGIESMDSDFYADLFYIFKRDKITFNQDILNGKNDLIKNKLVELENGLFLNDFSITLSQKSITILKSCGIIIKKNTQKNLEIIEPKIINKVDLFFNDSELQQIELLKSLLSEKKYNTTINKLKKKKLPTGITILLHGLAGTGKTEIVKQIAKKANRKILKIDISNTKSMWHGESEKIIKRLFNDYKTLKNEEDLTPILFINEADALFSKRKPIETSNVAQTENTIQNIILEELENFEGILIATTNFANHFDFAFERRFLFKIPINLPEVEVRYKIWKSKFASLTDANCMSLAKKFQYTGGQINNILRKKEINEILNSEKITFSKIIQFCNDETLSNYRPVGF